MNYAEFSLIRFGSGLAPGIMGPPDADALLETLSDPDATPRYPGLSTVRAGALLAEFDAAGRAQREGQAGADTRRENAKTVLVEEINAAHRARLARAVEHPTGFPERLLQFWSSHFSIRAGGPHLRAMLAAFHEDALKPHLTGSFGTLLRAATLHPAMLIYLDQQNSVGPTSTFAVRNLKRGNFGLNENHARELLELHSIGIDGGYGQADVRELAELMTGLRLGENRAFTFDAKRAEPGAETVMGIEYGGGRPPRLSEFDAFLDDIATHPQTAAHISRKLATHFCADSPPERLVADMTARFRQTRGDLMAVYEVMAGHEEARLSFGEKVRQPRDLVIAGLRALSVSGAEVMSWSTKSLHAHAIQPMRQMGQHVLGAPQPEGWPEAASAWLTPQLLAARIDWAMRWPGRMRDNLPDPRNFVRSTLAAAQAETVGVYAARAESQSDGIGIVLASPQFNRR
ncbi:Uncharacterized conserved protein, DUF1800 family [Paracoccus isoporae]|uniref:Uncharacterized conserved protein, DUF1800 family n=1 Tax=Paracoccus isoporae TaxID=591205 RepID=A0A1G7CSL7_9RHOB|nr:DUF1800 domain-containing protein [Paracoccus isoporae]SDE42307.1 Uncharacterized conserved protein, DUF1800 family [Paracoccus isoporae]